MSLSRLRCGRARSSKVRGVGRRRVGSRLARAVPFVVAVAPAGCDAPASTTQRATQPIVDGTPAPEYTGVVYVTHPSSDEACSGTVIAPTLVVTSKHCAFRRSSSGDQPLAGAAFRVGFGPDLERLESRYSTAATWVGAPEELDVQASIDAGEDVAVLTLGEPVPRGTHVHAVAWDYAPAASDAYELVGYGLTEPDGSEWGTKRVTTDAASGFDAVTGRLDATGNGACGGDSGGPFFHGDRHDLVAVISEMGASSETATCDLGLTRGASLANERVYALLAEALAALPPCSSRAEICDNQQDENCNGVPDDGCTGSGVAGAAGAGAGGASNAPRAGAGGTSGSNGKPAAGAAGEAELVQGGQGSAGRDQSSAGHLDGAADSQSSRGARPGCACELGIGSRSRTLTLLLGFVGAGLAVLWRRGGLRMLATSRPKPVASSGCGAANGRLLNRDAIETVCVEEVNKHDY